MTIDSVIQKAMVDLSGVELTIEHIAEMTLNMASKVKAQAGVSLSQKIENVKTSLRTFVNSREFQDPTAAQKLLNIIDTKVGVTLATELREPFFRKIVSSMYSLFWPSCSKTTGTSMDVSASDVTVSEADVTVSDSSENLVVVQDEKEAVKKACSVSCCSTIQHVEELVFTVLEAVADPIVETVAEAVVEPVLEVVKTSAWCHPKKGKKKSKKNGAEVVKGLESVKEPEVVKDLESIKEPEVVKDLESIKEPEVVVSVPENPPEPIQPENLSIYK